MANFDEAFACTMRWEEDLRDVLGRHFSWVNRENITIENAKYILFLQIWCKIQGMRIKDQCIANVIFDAAVDIDLNTAIIFAQECSGASIVNGVCGHETIRRLNEVLVPACFLSKFSAMRIKYYADSGESVLRNNFLRSINFC